ncbi:MAG: valine--tRNA ligase [Lentisphaeria bacterium]
MTEIAKAYIPKDVEAKWYPQWEERGYFKGQAEEGKDSYTIVIPPPNVTGILTLGHVLNNTLQDILIRWEKLRGKSICWVPGTDHAGIATQSKVEHFLLESEGKTRYDYGREKFLEKVWDWKHQYGGKIIEQLRTIGSSCDWERERFTLDEGLSTAVQEVFVRLYEKGLIYKGTRIINWCPKSQTALSDEEVEYKENHGKLWHFRYPLTDGSGFLEVATTRPETMFGDTGVAVSPDDERYSHMIGKTLMLPIVNREIPIFADTYVDKEFGTGAVKVTPAHDPNDYEMGKRHNLAMINVMNGDGTMNAEAGFCEGMDRYEARKAVVAQMQEIGLMGEIKDYVHQVGFSERGYVPVEPRLSAQWFVKMKPLAEPALAAVNEGKIKFHPERWVKTYNHWLENIQDWCISRQLWWGHRIPIWYKGEEIKCQITSPGEGWEQDPDVLDTWFSSWLWPFSVFDWPNENEDLKNFYPTSTLVTGPDIIFFWVARMIMAGIEFMGEVPFKDVYFTSIIRDESGRKMSKSLNNSPDPLAVVDQYGADALRFTIIYIAPTGNDIKFGTEKCEIGRNFVNKIWNAARFRRMQGATSTNWQNLDNLDASKLRAEDKWILAKLNDAIVDMTQSLEKFDFHHYTMDLYEFIWNQYCDWYVESAKPVFFKGSDEEKAVIFQVMDFIFASMLKLLHPIMPFVTEELYHNMEFASEEESIMNAAWPTAFSDEDIKRLGCTAELANLVDQKFDLIRAGRNLKNTYNIPSVKKIPFFVKPADEKIAEFLNADISALRSLLNASEVTIDENYCVEGATPSSVASIGTIFMPLDGLVNVQEEKEKLLKQQEELSKLIASTEAKLANESFVARAPEAVVNKEREKIADYQEKLAQTLSLLAAL